jgi:hypothetical protein
MSAASINQPSAAPAEPKVSVTLGRAVGAYTGIYTAENFTNRHFAGRNCGTGNQTPLKHLSESDRQPHWR